MQFLSNLGYWLQKHTDFSVTVDLSNSFIIVMQAAALSFIAVRAIQCTTRFYFPAELSLEQTIYTTYLDYF